LLLLFTGFLLVCVSWGVALRLSGNRVRWTDAVKSQGVYVFAKYIPGKLWAVMGRASWFSPGGSGLKTLSLVSLQEQLVFLWWGLFLSIPATFLVLQQAWSALVIAAATLVFTILLFSGHLYRNFSGIINRLFKKEWEFKPMKWSFFLRVSLPVLLFWALWSAGFWLLMVSMFNDIHIILALVFPAGITFGFLMIFLPAGLGVREGALAAFLIAGGLTPANAATISVVSRFWFVSGEIFLFVLALTLKSEFKTGSSGKISD
jgi:glycosyltransferase 2 family protein